jgi:hypothetical protein
MRRPKPVDSIVEKKPVIKKGKEEKEDGKVSKLETYEKLIELYQDLRPLDVNFTL